MDSNGTGNKAYKIKRDIVIDDEMFYSEPFKALSASALRTLMRCLQKRSWKKEKVNGRKKMVYTNPDFIFPYAEADFLDIGTTQFWKNMKQLIEMGFIDLVYQGGWYQKNQREKDYSVYRLSDRWKKYGTSEFKQTEKARVLQPDFYIRKNLERKKTRATSQKRRGQLRNSEVEGAKQPYGRLHKSEVEDKVQEFSKRPASAI